MSSGSSCWIVGVPSACVSCLWELRSRIHAVCKDRCKHRVLPAACRQDLMLLLCVPCRHHWVRTRTEVLDSTRYRQMAGRAGRAGIDDAGEAILLATRDVRTKTHLLGLMQVTCCSASTALGSQNHGVSRQRLYV